ncbi:UNVERIFIED_CONTAM: Vesicular integral-membrane protein VIP36 [Trichonephila clavipes]
MCTSLSRNSFHQTKFGATSFSFFLQISKFSYWHGVETPAQEEEDRSKIAPAAAFFTPPRDHIDDPPPPMSGTKLFLIIVCALLGLCVCVIGGAIIFQRSQDSARKRLY